MCALITIIMSSYVHGITAPVHSTAPVHRGEDCVKRSIVCEACKIFEPILSINHQCMKKHKARVFIIRYCINCQNFLGGKLEGLGGSFPPPRTPVDETLHVHACSTHHITVHMHTLAMQGGRGGGARELGGGPGAGGEGRGEVGGGEGEGRS